MKRTSALAPLREVIKGWDQGLLGMKLGEERQVIIPGHEGYGKDGRPGAKSFRQGHPTDFKTDSERLNLNFVYYATIALSLLKRQEARPSVVEDDIRRGRPQASYSSLV